MRNKEHLLYQFELRYWIDWCDYCMEIKRFDDLMALNTWHQRRRAALKRPKDAPVIPDIERVRIIQLIALRNTYTEIHESIIAFRKDEIRLRNSDEWESWKPYYDGIEM